VKPKVLVTILVVAIVADIALLLTSVYSGRRIKQLKSDRARLEKQVQMTGNRSDRSIWKAGERQPFYRRDFVSFADGRKGTYALAPPAKDPASGQYRLIVYFHGMGSNYMEPFFHMKKGQ